MHKNKSSSIVKGVGVGMLIGGATAIMGSSIMGSNSNGKKYRKMADKAIRTAGDVIDSISNSLN